MSKIMALSEKLSVGRELDKDFRGVNFDSFKFIFKDNMIEKGCKEYLKFLN